MYKLNLKKDRKEREKVFEQLQNKDKPRPVVHTNLDKMLLLDHERRGLILKKSY